MMTIDRNAFAGIEDFLTELYIKESNLKSLPKDSIDFLHELAVFSVENSQIMTSTKVIEVRIYNFRGVFIVFAQICGNVQKGILGQNSFLKE